MAPNEHNILIIHYDHIYTVYPKPTLKTFHLRSVLRGLPPFSRQWRLLILTRGDGDATRSHNDVTANRVTLAYEKLIYR